MPAGVATQLGAYADEGQVEMVKSLLSSPGINVDERVLGERALTRACENGHVEVVKLLVAAGARVEQQAGDRFGPLDAAIVGNHLQLVKYLVEAGADARRTRCDGSTPLMLAAETGRADMVKYLLGRPSIDVDQTTFTGRRALIIACVHGYLEVAKLLVGAGARVNPQSSSEWGPLLQAISGGHLQLVKYLVEEAGADMQRVGPHGITLLMVAVGGDHADIVEYLLGRPGIDVDEVGMNGERALIRACANGKLEVVKLLVAAGARIETQTGEELGPLIKAAFHGHLEVVKYLVEEAGADVTPADPAGWRPFADYKGHADIVEYLRPIVAQRKQREEQRKQHEEVSVSPFPALCSTSFTILRTCVASVSAPASRRGEGCCGRCCIAGGGGQRSGSQGSQQQEEKEEGQEEGRGSGTHAPSPSAFPGAATQPYA
jgi:ankyrin repeat protein